ncbi:MAG: 50S ribosomal protein L18 [Bacillota bacterium]|nr:50S ribosomal protein L18 [Bacillota bacterium]
MLKQYNRKAVRARKHLSVRSKVHGTAERPRLNIFKSLNHIYAQVIDDVTGLTLVSASSVDPELKEQLSFGGNIDAAKAVGQLIAKRAVEKGISKVVFDRGGYIYHGRVAALADAAREAGLEF